MAEKSMVSHEGYVIEANGSKFRVKIESVSACASCRLKSHCPSSEVEDKVIDVFFDVPPEPGDHVNVFLKESMAWKAIVYTYIIPLIVVVVSLFTVYLLTGNEVAGGIFALLSLLPYYTVLYFLRGRFEKEFIFTGKKITKK